MVRFGGKIFLWIGAHLHNNRLFYLRHFICSYMPHACSAHLGCDRGTLQYALHARINEELQYGGPEVEMKSYQQLKYNMLRIALLTDYRGCHVKHSLTTLRQFFHIYGGGVASTLANKCTTGVFVDSVERFHLVAQRNGRLLQMFEDLQKKTKENPQREQLVSSFCLCLLYTSPSPRDA